MTPLYLNAAEGWEEITCDSDTSNTRVHHREIRNPHSLDKVFKIDIIPKIENGKKSCQFNIRNKNNQQYYFTLAGELNFKMGNSTKSFYMIPNINSPKLYKDNLGNLKVITNNGSEIYFDIDRSEIDEEKTRDFRVKQTGATGLQLNNPKKPLITYSLASGYGNKVNDGAQIYIEQEGRVCKIPAAELFDYIGLCNDNKSKCPVAQDRAVDVAKKSWEVFVDEHNTMNAKIEEENLQRIQTGKAPKPTYPLRDNFNSFYKSIFKDGVIAKYNTPEDLFQAIRAHKKCKDVLGQLPKGDSGISTDIKKKTISVRAEFKEPSQNNNENIPPKHRITEIALQNEDAEIAEKQLTDPLQKQIKKERKRKQDEIREQQLIEFFKEKEKKDIAFEKREQELERTLSIQTSEPTKDKITLSEPEDHAPTGSHQGSSVNCKQKILDYFNHEVSKEELKKFMRIQSNITLHRIAWTTMKASKGNTKNIEEVILDNLEKRDPKVYNSFLNKQFKTRNERLNQAMFSLKELSTEIGEKENDTPYHIQYSDLKMVNLILNVENESGRSGKEGARDFISIIKNSMKKRLNKKKENIRQFENQLKELKSNQKEFLVLLKDYLKKYNCNFYDQFGICRSQRKQQIDMDELINNSREISTIVTEQIFSKKDELKDNLKWKSKDKNYWLKVN